jgi:hypothetical protein
VRSGYANLPDILSLPDREIMSTPQLIQDARIYYVPSGGGVLMGGESCRKNDTSGVLQRKKCRKTHSGRKTRPGIMATLAYIVAALAICLD